LKVCPLPQALQGVGPHAPAIKHAPYAAREGALAGKSERDAHHAAGHETMANLAGKGFGALRAAAGVANPTVRLPQSAVAWARCVPHLFSRVLNSAELGQVGEDDLPWSQFDST
jgi:hypothetical protein